MITPHRNKKKVSTRHLGKVTGPKLIRNSFHEGNERKASYVNEAASSLTINDIPPTVADIISTTHALHVHIPDTIVAQLSKDGCTTLETTLEDFLLRIVEKGRAVAVRDGQGKSSVTPPPIQGNHIREAKGHVLREMNLAREQGIWLLRVFQILLAVLVGLTFPTQPNSSVIPFVLLFSLLSISYGIEPWISKR